MSPLTDSQKAELYDFAVEHKLIDLTAADALAEAMMDALDRKMAAIRAAVGVASIPFKPAAAKPGKPVTAAEVQTASAAAAKRKSPPSKSRQLQGRYLALVRRFPKSKRKQFSIIAKTSGREQAIAAMETALSAAGAKTRTKPTAKPSKSKAAAAKPGKMKPPSKKKRQRRRPTRKPTAVAETAAAVPTSPGPQ